MQRTWSQTRFRAILIALRSNYKKKRIDQAKYLEARTVADVQARYRKQSTAGEETEGKWCVPPHPLTPCPPPTKKNKYPPSHPKKEGGFITSSCLALRQQR